uniref:Uncharacterized protein n=1 Tax=Anguilla anguilla TaxID=7936 RepID=A0A0E9XN60_ANGAN
MPRWIIKYRCVSVDVEWVGEELQNHKHKVVASCSIRGM